METDLVTRARAAFFSAMCRSDPFSELLRAAYQLLGWPVLAGDDASNVILQIPDEAIGSVWYDTLLNDRHVHPELYAQFQQAMGTVYNPKGEALQVIPGENDRYPAQVYLTVRLSGATAAQIVFHMPKAEPDPREREVLENLLLALTAECRKARRMGSLPSRRIQHQMRLLLDGDRDEDILRHHAKSLERAVTGDYVLVVSLLEEDARKEDFAPFYMDQVGQRVPGAVSMSYQGNLVTLCGEIRGDPAPRLGPLWEFARACCVVTGVTARFSGSLTRLGTMYQQALLTARLGRRVHPREWIFFFDALAPLQVFVPALQEFRSETFLHPSILAVMEYDEKNGTEYLKTLRAYLVTGKSNRETIRLLSVHSNTLLYRLTKIKDLFDIDLTDGKLTLTLLSNVLLLEVARPDLLPLFEAEPAGKREG